MDRAARYRREAAQLRRTAEKIRDQDLRRQLLDIAESYEELAKNITRRNRREPET